MKINENLLYSHDHEWVKVEGNLAYVGITDFAQHQMGNIVYVELPEIDSEVSQDEAMSSAESVKAASDILAPLSGTIVKVNEVLEDSPQLLNEAPFEHWIVQIAFSNPAELATLLDSKAYAKFCSTEEA